MSSSSGGERVEAEKGRYATLENERLCKQPVGSVEWMPGRLLAPVEIQQRLHGLSALTQQYNSERGNYVWPTKGQ